jgi:hypothetical protein
MDQAEGCGDFPAGLVLAPEEDAFGCDIRNRKRDRRLDDARRNPNPAEQRESQGQRVPEGEAGDGDEHLRKSSPGEDQT